MDQSTPLNATGFIIQRSRPTARTFTQVGTTAANVTNFSRHRPRRRAQPIPIASLQRAPAAIRFPRQACRRRRSQPHPPSPTSATLHGPARQQAGAPAQNDATIVGNTLSLRGTTYAKGIGTHAAFPDRLQRSTARIPTSSPTSASTTKNCSKALAPSISRSSATARSSSTAASSRTTSPIVSINVSVGGVQQLTLLATNGNRRQHRLRSRRLGRRPPTLGAACNDRGDHPHRDRQHLYARRSLVTQPTVAAPITTSSIIPAVAASNVTAPTPQVGVRRRMTVIYGPAARRLDKCIR